MNYALTRTADPAVEPVSSDDAKLHCRVESTDEDTLLDIHIATAREMAEAYTSRAFITSTFTLKMDDFPENYGDIRLPRTPLGSVSSITYVDTSGSTQTLATSVYEVLSDDTRARVVLKPSQRWPNTQSLKREAVTVTFTAGYGSAASDVPKAVRSAMLLIVGHLYENREQVVTGTSATSLPLGVTHLLDTVSARVPV